MGSGCHAHGRCDSRFRPVRRAAGERVVSNRGADPSRDVIAFLARGSGQQHHHLVRRRVHHDVVAAQVAPNQLDDLFTQRGEVRGFDRWLGERGAAVGIHLNGQHRRRVPARGSGGNGIRGGGAELGGRRGQVRASGPGWTFLHDKELGVDQGCANPLP